MCKVVVWSIFYLDINKNNTCLHLDNGTYARKIYNESKIWTKSCNIESSNIIIFWPKYLSKLYRLNFFSLTPRIRILNYYLSNYTIEICLKYFDLEFLLQIAVIEIHSCIIFIVLYYYVLFCIITYILFKITVRSKSYLTN